MKASRRFDAIDVCRLIAAFIVVGVHTYPLTSVNTELNFIFAHIFARIAVPFFLMATGFFLLPQYLNRENHDTKPLKRFIKKTAILYAGASLLYLPISIYAGYYSSGNVLATVIRNILIDGTFYHLWYLPAVITGMVLVYALCRKFPFHVVFGLTLLLYLIGLPGDSYYGITAKIPLLSAAYDTGFHIFSYTRNGLFYAPVFLAMGAAIAQRERPAGRRTCIIGMIAFMSLMLAEGILLRRFGHPRHDSMYIALLPCMFFLFQLISSYKGKRSVFLRDTTMWVYILHPLFYYSHSGNSQSRGAY
jgi:serine/alanine racemase